MFHISLADLGEYIGCYKDANDRAMTGDWQNGGDMTIDNCIGICAEQVMTC